MITNTQARAARALVGLSQGDLARIADVNTRTVMDFESGKRTPIPATQNAIKLALQNAGVEFIPENGGGPGVRLAKRGES